MAPFEVILTALAVVALVSFIALRIAARRRSETRPSPTMRAQDARRARKRDARLATDRETPILRAREPAKRRKGEASSSADDRRPREDRP